MRRLFSESTLGVFIYAGHGLALAGGRFVVEHHAVVMEHFAEDFLAGGVAALGELHVVENVVVASDHADHRIQFVGAMGTRDAKTVGDFSEFEVRDFGGIGGFVVQVLPGGELAAVAGLEPSFRVVFVRCFHGHVQVGHVTVANEGEFFLELVINVHVAIVGETRGGKGQGGKQKLLHDS